MEDFNISKFLLVHGSSFDLVGEVEYSTPCMGVVLFKRVCLLFSSLGHFNSIQKPHTTATATATA